MSNVRNQINDIKLYDPCVHINPGLLGNILLELLNFSEPVELSLFMKGTSFLPKTAGLFLFEGLPVHYRSVEHNGNYFIIFCAGHNGSTNHVGEMYIVYVRRENGSFQFYTAYTSKNVTDWVKRTFNECTATSSYPGQMSSLMYKRLNAVYNWCVKQGMPNVSDDSTSSTSPTTNTGGTYFEGNEGEFNFRESETSLEDTFIKTP